MLLSFELTMPNKASWNGRWSGEDKKYYVIKSVYKRWLDKTEYLKDLKDKGVDNFYYRWEDGWGANVCVEIINGTEARKRRKVSAGFCSYNWMIDSIMIRGCIKSTYDLKSELVTP